MKFHEISVALKFHSRGSSYVRYINPPAHHMTTTDHTPGPSCMDTCTIAGHVHAHAHDLSQRRALFPFSVSLVAGGKQDGGARAEVAGGDPAIGEAGERMELAGTF